MVNIELQLLLATLAVYRIAHIVALEDGPFDAFAKLRYGVGQADWIGRGLHCVLCVSFWLALFAAICLTFTRIDLGGLLLTWLGIAGGVLVLYSLERR